MSELLDSLSSYGLHQVNNNRYVCRCPAHEDKTPSMSVQLADNDITLIHCFAGCSPEDILSSLGLTYRALFPDDPDFDKNAWEKKKQIRRDEKLAKHYYIVLKTADDNFKRGVELIAEDKKLIKQAQSYFKEHSDMTDETFRRLFINDMINNNLEYQSEYFAGLSNEEKYGLSDD